jgi:hypothetical protein
MFGSVTTWIIAGLIALNAGTYAVQNVRHKWQLSTAVAAARTDEAKAQVAACTAKIAKIEADTHDYTEGQVSAGAEAASEVLPITVETRQARCRESKLCRDRHELGGE